MLHGKIGLLGDLHTEDAHLALALETFARHGVTTILAVGDFVDGVGDIDRCITLLQAANVLGVRGNHDRWFLASKLRTLPNATLQVSDETRAFLEALPVERALETPLGPLLLCHGVGDNDMGRFLPDDQGYALESNFELHAVAARARIVVGGHTHRRMLRQHGGALFINAGTLLRDHDPCFAELDLDARTLRFYDFEADGALREASPLSLP